MSLSIDSALLYQEGLGLGLNPSIEPQSLSTQNSVTRKAGGRKEGDKEMQVCFSSLFIFILLPLREGGRIEVLEGTVLEPSYFVDPHVYQWATV